ncbi:MAG: hypothetical protein K2Q22_09985 [Cytophagales bacterium]|nr:hypothetical protein [Cytophagales bacterium]
MTKTFTPDDIIRYVYGETNTEENRLIEHQLAGDTALRHYSRELKGMKNLLIDGLLSPSEKSINNILAYAQARAPKAGMN